ncbi:MAG TPA: hypothetical protein ENK10_04850 [Acidobacteria bacterium]|nr:hypothetical protein [Acidobacteriota bacterium]
MNERIEFHSDDDEPCIPTTDRVALGHHETRQDHPWLVEARLQEALIAAPHLESEIYSARGLARGNAEDSLIVLTQGFETEEHRRKRTEAATPGPGDVELRRATWRLDAAHDASRLY